MMYIPDFDPNAPDVVAAINEAVAGRDSSHNHNLYSLLPERLRKPEFRSVFIDGSWAGGIEEYDGKLAEAFQTQGTTAVERDILGHLAVIVPKLKEISPDYFAPKQTYEYFETIFYSHPSGQHTVYVIWFDNAGTVARDVG